MECLAVTDIKKENKPSGRSQGKALAVKEGRKRSFTTESAEIAEKMTREDVRCVPRRMRDATNTPRSQRPPR
jgi:hypothetical protein